MTQQEKAHPTHQPPGRRLAVRFWLVVKVEPYPMEILTFSCGGDEALPVFSHEEEAELFLCLGGIGEGWRVRKSSAGEVVSLLFGPCAGVGSVALDPSPVMSSEMIGLVRLGRDRFVDLIGCFGRKRSFARSGWILTPGRISMLFESSNRGPRTFLSATCKLLR